MDVRMDLKKAERVSKALGDPYRLRIIEAIHNEGDWLAHSIILDMFNLAQSTISHHIKQLTDAGLLLVAKEGRNAKYQINKEVLGVYIKYLSQFEA